MMQQLGSSTERLPRNQSRRLAMTQVLLVFWRSSPIPLRGFSHPSLRLRIFCSSRSHLSLSCQVMRAISILAPFFLPKRRKLGSSQPTFAKELMIVGAFRVPLPCLAVRANLQLASAGTVGAAAHTWDSREVRKKPPCIFQHPLIDIFDECAVGIISPDFLLVRSNVRKKEDCCAMEGM